MCVCVRERDGAGVSKTFQNKVTGVAPCLETSALPFVCSLPKTGRKLRYSASSIVGSIISNMKSDSGFRNIAVEQPEFELNAQPMLISQPTYLLSWTSSYCSGSSLTSVRSSFPFGTRLGSTDCSLIEIHIPGLLIPVDRTHARMLRGW